jgi:uroporphyrin-III C-methyltransferase
MKKQKKGFVAIVGAGPGDPDLITLKGAAHLARADVVLMDALVHPEVLKHCASRARILDVGKRAGGKSTPQEVISRILVQEGAAGQYVVRLKGGDPFVFGRGGEEALALSEAGIPFEVVSGVSSSVAAAAACHIPVTHRGQARQFMVVTATSCNEADPLYGEYGAVIASGGTVVFLMALGPLPHIVSGLIEAGLDGETRAAMIQDGTGAGQKIVSGALERLPHDVKLANLGSPALLVVGQVVALRDEILSAQQRATLHAHELNAEPVQSLFPFS